MEDEMRNDISPRQPKEENWLQVFLATLIAITEQKELRINQILSNKNAYCL